MNTIYNKPRKEHWVILQESSCHCRFSAEVCTVTVTPEDPWVVTVGTVGGCHDPLGEPNALGARFLWKHGHFVFLLVCDWDVNLPFSAIYVSI